MQIGTGSVWEYAEGVGEFQPRVGTTLGEANEEVSTLKVLANDSGILPTLSALAAMVVLRSQGSRKLEPWAEISERLRRIVKRTGTVANAYGVMSTNQNGGERLRRNVKRTRTVANAYGVLSN